MMDNPLVFPIRDLNEHPGPWGLTMRDYFAGQALASLIAAATENLLVGNPGETNGQTIARMAFDMADAMLRARSASVEE